ncbi:MAG TPA: M28 family peptidase [Firmicutes bacterium]|uniref:M28 family peptidase n=1 Tax=Capillibacterium thermochitinicola TaxID=2699427 RepID=A0A8J6LMX2_9FIRM|nr:M28 family peptidase [Capillibacterium thermochitinicola]MBA2133308.1 M28 family peptidase [Capillibacterium thermochitinicola]HHW12266.1 M28 family peptidase [Bacillota bacterium]
MSQAYRHVQYLAETIGPRGSCTEAEKRAAHYLKKELAQFNLNLTEEQFKAVSSFSWVFGLIDLLLISAALIFPSRPEQGLALAFFAFIAFILESNTFPFLSRLIPKKNSQNLVAQIPARSKPIRKVIITAHYDSSRSAINFSPKLVKGFRRSYLLLVGAMATEVLLYALAVFTSLSPLLLWYLSLPGVLYILVTFLTLLHRELAGQYTPGANDNASGVAVLLEVAKILTRFPLITTEVTLVATGAEESGTNGALAFLRRHRPPKDTYVINLDNLGSGHLTAVTAEGILGTKAASAELLSLAKTVAAEKNLSLRFAPYKLLTTDGTVFLMRNYPTVSLMAFDDDGLLPNWHWPTDRAAAVKPENLDAAKELVLGILRKLES